MFTSLAQISHYSRMLAGRYNDTRPHSQLG
ncbi:hypothetical protein [Bradyrhizobium sp. RDI18]